MGSLRKRLGRLEAGGASTPVSSASASEARRLTKEARRLDAEIAAEEASMTEDEIREARSDDEEFAASLDGLDLDGKTAIIEEEIARYTKGEA